MTSEGTRRRDWTTSSLGERIEHICELRGWSLNKLGEEAGIASGPMSRLSRMEVSVGASPDTLWRLAEAGHVSIVWLMFGRGPVETMPSHPEMLRLHPDWPAALEEARKRQRGIPKEFWNMAGDSVLHVATIDWQLVVGLVRELYSAYQRSLDIEEGPASASAGRSTPRRPPPK